MYEFRNLPQVVTVEDQDPVQALGPDGAHPPFGVGVRAGCSWWDPQHLESRAGEHRIEARRELAPVAAREEDLVVAGIRGTEAPQQIPQ